LVTTFLSLLILLSNKVLLPLLLEQLLLFLCCIGAMVTTFLSLLILLSNRVLPTGCSAIIRGIACACTENSKIAESHINVTSIPE
jgi:hypothetical protein